MSYPFGSLPVPPLNPCTPTLSVPTGAAPSLGGLLASAASNVEGAAAAGLASLQANVTGALAADEAAVVGQLNLLSLNVQSLASAFSAGGFSVGVSFTLGPSLGSIESIVAGLASRVVASAEQSIISAATSAITGAISGAVGALTNLAIGELQKDLAPLLSALSLINGALGQINADKLLLQQILSNATSCQAKAELLAEVYFKQGAK